MITQIPDILRGDGQVYVRVDSFTDTEKRRAVPEALDHFMYDTDFEDDAFVAKLATAAKETKLRAHTEADEDCVCGADDDDWWCEDGHGIEGSFVSFDREELAKLIAGFQAGSNA